AGNNMIFFIGLRESHHGIKFLVEFGACSMGHQTPLSIVLRCTCGRSERIHSLIGDISPGEWAIILDPMPRRVRKNHHVGTSKCSNGGHHCRDKMLPPCWGLVGVGRRFDGEAGIVCIKGDASAHTPYAYAALVAILGLSSGRTSDPGILRGRILVRLMIRGMRSFNKTQRPKLRILMLDPAGLALVSMPNREDGTAKVGHNRCWDDLASCFHGTRRTLGMLFQNMKIHPSKTHGSWMRFFINWRLYGLSSRNHDAELTFVPNPEAGWTIILEPGGWFDYRPGTQRLVGLPSRNPEVGWTIILEPGGWMDYRPGTRWLCGPSRGPSRFLEKCLPLSKPGSVFQCVVQLPLGRLTDGTRCVRFVNLEYRDAHDGCRGRSRSFSQQEPGGRCPARGLDDISQPASHGQDIAPVILLSQVLLRSVPCLDLEENKFPWERPGLVDVSGFKGSRGLK
ncbi:LOW QUALITY PROTEIN: hypothetical protein HID58_048418, partial [Brassica napus]